MASRSYQVDVGKLLVLLASIASVTALGLAGVLDSAATQTLIALAVGYTAGNGNLARRGETPVPLVGPSPSHPERPANLARQIAQCTWPEVAVLEAAVAESKMDGEKDGVVDGPPPPRARARHGSAKRSAPRGDS